MPTPNQHIAPDYDTLCDRVVDYLLKRLSREPRLLLCAPGGTTPLGIYDRLAKLAEADPTPFERLRVVKLDEWLGLPPGHEAGIETVLRQRLIEPLQIGPDRYLTFAEAPRDSKVEMRRVQRLLDRDGPIDICLLGLGANGHLGMNEPAAELTPGPHVGELSPETKKGLKFVGSANVSHGLTLGMADILNSREILVLASGEAKAPAVARLMKPRIATTFPASLLWLHSRVTLFADRAAAGPMPLPAEKAE